MQDAAKRYGLNVNEEKILFNVEGLLKILIRSEKTC